MKRDRKFAKNRKCNDPMNFKGGSTRRSFDDGSRLWKLFPEQLEITRLLAVKRCSTINSLISKSRIPVFTNMLNLNACFFVSFVEIVEKRLEKNIPSHVSLSSTRSNAREIPNASSIRLATREPFLTPSKRSPFRSPTSASITPDSRLRNAIPARATRLCFWHFVSRHAYIAIHKYL